MLDKENKNIVLLQGCLADSFFADFKREQNKEFFVLEGRPTLEAARRNCRRLQKKGITPTLIADNMAGFLFFKGMVRDIWLAYQFADKDGALCDAGALILAVLGFKHRVRVHLFPAGRSTKFFGRQKDVSHFMGKRIAPSGILAYAPLVDWVPGKYFRKIGTGGIS